MIAKEGNRYSYIDLNGVVHKYFRKEWNKNANSIFELVMSEFEQKNRAITSTVVEDVDAEGVS
jgi:hypothetical protein